MSLTVVKRVLGILLTAGWMHWAGTAGAASILFQDTYDRDSNRDIDATMTGIINNTGTVFATSAVYTSPWVDPATAAPAFGTPDGNAANGGGQQILNSQLQLKYGTGTANAFINHNFINQEILARGGFSVSMDVASTGGSAGAGFGAGFAIGMSQAEALSTQDAISGSKKMQDGFQASALNTEASVAVSDFWVVLRADNFLQYGSDGHSLPFNTGPAMNEPGPAYIGGTNVGKKLGTIRASFRFADFDAGTPVYFKLFLDGAFVDDGTFAWSETNQNYIGVDGRDGNFVNIDNLTVFVPEPATALLGLLCIAVLGGRRDWA